MISIRPFAGEGQNVFRPRSLIRSALLLRSKLAELSRKLKLAQGIEKAQQKKANFEKERLTRGRSTTSQVILFENDYSQALIAKVRIQQDLLRTYSQMKTFQGSAL